MNSSNSVVGSFDRFSSTNSRPFSVSHSFWLYSIFPGFLFVIYCLLASLVVNLSDSSTCESPIRAFLYLSIACGYIFVFFLCYLFLFGRPKRRTFQNSFLAVFSLIFLAVTLWGSAVLYNSGVIERSFSSSLNSTDPGFAAEFSFFLDSTPCTRTLAFRISLLGLAINYLFFALLFFALFYTLAEFCCCKDRLKTTEILGIGGVERTRARKLMEIQLAREAGMAIVQEEFMKNMKTYQENDEEIKNQNDQKNNQNNNQNNQNNGGESERLFNRTGWAAQ